MRVLQLCLTVCILAYASFAAAGAWTQPRGDGLFITQATYFSSDAFFDGEGIAVEQPRFSKFELQPYVEYGVRDWLTVGGTAGLQRVSQEGDGNTGVGDPELFARVRLWPRTHEVFTLQPLIKLPSYYTQSGTPRGGSRSTDAELSLLYGRASTLYGLPYYTDTRVGYRVRGRGLNPQWRIDAAAGIRVLDDVALIPAIRSVIATQFDEDTVFREDGEQDYDLMKIELTTALHLNDKQWLQVTVFDHVAGALAGNGRGISIGMAERF